MFENQKVLITGGTGSFGNAVLKKLLKTNTSEIRIFSRDEKKQEDMRKAYGNSNLQFYLGDVRDQTALNTVMEGIDYVFHAAALKQVPSCEFYPQEAVKTNVLGTENVIEAAICKQVKTIVCLSTDKAVYPINSMGMSKALMEKIAVAKCRFSSPTKICVTRYGNVMGSRGSVIPLFIEQIESNKPITVTNPAMTRFMMSLDEAVELVLYAFQNGEPGDIFVKKSPAANIETLVQALLQLFKLPNHPEVIGTRHGEKLYESLLSVEEFSKAEDHGDYYRICPDFRGLNYSLFVEKGDHNLSSTQDYNSNNTNRLCLEECLRYFQSSLKSKNIHYLKGISQRH